MLPKLKEVNLNEILKVTTSGRTASDDTGYRSSSPADAADKPPEHYDKTTESPETDDGCSDPPDPLSINTHEPGRPDRTPHAIKERLKM